jgi:hypothetical protein
VTGYAVADPAGRIARNARTGAGGPAWFGGRSLAADLTLPALRTRWQATGPDAALAAWTADPGIPPPRITPDSGRIITDAGIIAVTGTGCGSVARCDRLHAATGC